MTLPDPPVLVITDRRMAALPLRDVIDGALKGGCRWVLLREPDLGGDALVALGLELVPLCARHGAVLSVSADVDTAAVLGAGGVHLPQRLAVGEMVRQARARLGDTALVGVSCHSLAEAEAAERLGADYITLSPVFLTDSKPGYGPALGIGPLQAMIAKLRIPALGLAGISTGNAGEVRGAGASGIAVMGEVMRATDPARATSKLIDAWRG